MIHLILSVCIFQYYKTGHLREELVALRQDVQEVSRDRAYEETRDNYHHHFWRADHESENKCKFETVIY